MDYLGSLTLEMVVSVVLPEARPAGGWWLQRRQPWSSPLGQLGRPVSALNKKQSNDIRLREYRLTVPSSGHGDDE